MEAVGAYQLQKGCAYRSGIVFSILVLLSANIYNTLFMTAIHLEARFGRSLFSVAFIDLAFGAFLLRILEELTV